MGNQVEGREPVKKQAFVARTPLEIGDVVVTVANEVRTVTDILAVHSARTGAVTFQYVLDNISVVAVDTILYRLGRDGRPVALSSERVASTGPAR